MNTSHKKKSEHQVRPRMYVTADGFAYAKPEEIINSEGFNAQLKAVKELRKRVKPEGSAA